MTLAEKITYYTDLLIMQYRTAIRARKQVSLLTKQAMADDLIVAVRDAFAVDTAVGAQLDILGKYVGVPRNIGTPLPQAYFGLYDYGASFDLTKYKGTWNPLVDNPALPTAAGGNSGWWYVASQTGTSGKPINAIWTAGDVITSNGSAWLRSTEVNGNGFTDYADATVNAAGQFYNYAFFGNKNTDLADAPYRVLIKLQIVKHSNSSSLVSLQYILHAMFPGLITISDHQDMTIAYGVSSSLGVPIEVLRQFLPRPMGVAITVGLLLTESGAFITTESGNRLLIT